MNLYNLHTNPEELFGYNKLTTLIKSTDEYGKTTYKHPMYGYHREDGPAVEYLNGTKHWYKNGKLHREDGPAVEYADGDKEWFLNGKHHREDGPAVEYADGNKEWFLNGVEHTKRSHKNSIKNK